MLEVLRMSFKFIRLEESIIAESTINKKSKMLQLTVRASRSPCSYKSCCELILTASTG
jgi:hypothetical protein